MAASWLQAGGREGPDRSCLLWDALPAFGWDEAVVQPFKAMEEDPWRRLGCWAGVIHLVMPSLPAQWGSPPGEHCPGPCAAPGGSWFPPASHRGMGGECLTGSWEAWERRAEWAAVLCQRHLGFLWNWAVPALQELPPLCYSSWQEGGSLMLGMQALAEGSYFGVFTGLCHSARHL